MSNQLQGVCFPFRLEYRSAKNPGGLSDLDQARAILDETLVYQGLGYRKVGITYSANALQSQHIREQYDQGKWELDISGSNQANVIHHVFELLKSEPKYQSLQKVFYVLPITTIDKDKADQTAGLDQTILDDELLRMQALCENEGILLAWQNQDSNDQNPGKVFAIGGGVMKQWPDHQKLTSVQLNSVQNALQNLRTQFPAASLVYQKLRHQLANMKFKPTRFMSKERNEVKQLLLEQALEKSKTLALSNPSSFLLESHQFQAKDFPGKGELFAGVKLRFPIAMNLIQILNYQRSSIFKKGMSEAALKILSQSHWSAREKLMLFLSATSQRLPGLSSKKEHLTLCVMAMLSAKDDMTLSELLNTKIQLPNGHKKTVLEVLQEHRGLSFFRAPTSMRDLKKVFGSETVKDAMQVSKATADSRTELSKRG